jgi:hypothetical protein
MMVARNGQSSAFTSLASKLIEERWVYCCIAMYYVNVWKYMK